MSSTWLEREVVRDLAALLRRHEQRPARREDPGAAVVEDRVVLVGLLEELGGEVVLARDELREAEDPRHEDGAWRVATDRRGRRADGVDLLDVEGLQELPAAREVAIERRHADADAFGDRST
jgi:hypothetical protein